MDNSEQKTSWNSYIRFATLKGDQTMANFSNNGFTDFINTLVNSAQEINTWHYRNKQIIVHWRSSAGVRHLRAGEHSTGSAVSAIV